MAVDLPDSETTVVEVGSVDNVDSWVQLDTASDVEYRRDLYVKFSADGQIRIDTNELLDGEAYDVSNQGYPVTAGELFRIELPAGSGKAYVTCPTADAVAWCTVVPHRYR